MMKMRLRSSRRNIALVQQGNRRYRKVQWKNRVSVLCPLQFGMCCIHPTHIGSGGRSPGGVLKIPPPCLVSSTVQGCWRPINPKKKRLCKSVGSLLVSYRGRSVLGFVVSGGYFSQCQAKSSSTSPYIDG